MTENIRTSFMVMSWVLMSVRTQTTAPSLILKYQKNQLHYKHSYSITPRQVRVNWGGGKKKNTNLKFKKNIQKLHKIRVKNQYMQLDLTIRILRTKCTWL